MLQDYIMSNSDKIRNKVIRYIHEEIQKGSSILDLFQRFGESTLPVELGEIPETQEKAGYRYAQLELSRLMKNPEKIIRKDGKRSLNDSDLDKHLFGY